MTKSDKVLVKLEKDKFIISKNSESVDNKFIKDLIDKTIAKRNEIGSDVNDFIQKIIVEANNNSGDVHLFPTDEFFVLSSWVSIPKTEVFYYVDSSEKLGVKEILRILVNNRMFRYPMLPETLTINQLNIAQREERWYSKVGAVQLRTPSAQSKMFRKGAPDSKKFEMPDFSTFCVFGQMNEKVNVICLFANHEGDFDSLKLSLSLAFSAFVKRRNEKAKNQVIVLQSLNQWPGFEKSTTQNQSEYQLMVNQMSALYAQNNHIFVDSVDKMFNTDQNSDSELWVIFPWNSKSWIYHDDLPILLFNVVFNGGNENWTALDIIDSIYDKRKEPHFANNFFTNEFIGDQHMFFQAGMKLANHSRRAWNWKKLPIGYQNLPDFEKYVPVYQKIASVGKRKWNVGDFWMKQIDTTSIHLDILDKNSSGLGNFLIITNESNDIFYPRRFWNQFTHVLTTDQKQQTEIFIIPKESHSGSFPLSQTIENQLFPKIETEFETIAGEKWSTVRVEHLRLFQVMWLSTLALTAQLIKINDEINKELMQMWDQRSGIPKPNFMGAELNYLFNFLRATSFKFWLFINNLLSENLYFEFAQWDDIPLSFAAASEIVDTFVDDFYLSSKMMIFTSRLLNVLLTNVYIAPLKRKYFKSDKKIPESEMALYASKEIKTGGEYLCTYMGIRVASEFSVKDEVNKDDSTAIISPSIVKTELLSQSSYTVSLQSLAKQVLPNGDLLINTERVIPDDFSLITKLELIQRTIALLFVERKSISPNESQSKSDVEKFLTQRTVELNPTQLNTIFQYFPYINSEQMKIVYSILEFSDNDVKTLNEKLPIRLPLPSEIKNANDFKLWFSPFLANMTFDIWNPYLLGGDHMASMGKFANGAVTKQIKNDLVRQIPSAQQKIKDWITVNPNAEFVIYEMDPIESQTTQKFSNDYYLSSIFSTSVFLERNIKPRLKEESLLQPIMQGMEIITPTDFMSKIQIQFIKSTKPLKPDEEVIIDYGSEYWINIDTPFGKKNMIDTFDASRSIFSIYNYYFLLSNVSRNVIKSDKHVTDYLFLDKDLKLKKPETLSEINQRVATLSVIWDQFPLDGFKPEEIDAWFTQLEQHLGLNCMEGRKTVSNLATRLAFIEKATGLKNAKDLDEEIFEQRKAREDGSVPPPATRQKLIERVNKLVTDLNLNFAKLPQKSGNEEIAKVLNDVEGFLRITPEKQNIQENRNNFNNLIERLVFDEIAVIKFQQFKPPTNITEWKQRATIVSLKLQLDMPLNVTSESDFNQMNNWLSSAENKLNIIVQNKGKTFADMSKRLANIEFLNEDKFAVTTKIVQSVLFVLKSPSTKIEENKSEIKRLKSDSDPLVQLEVKYMTEENVILEKLKQLNEEFSLESLNQKVGETQSIDEILTQVIQKQITLLNELNQLINKTINEAFNIPSHQARNFVFQLTDERNAIFVIITKLDTTTLTQKVLSLYQAKNIPPPNKTQLKQKIIDIWSQ